MKKKSTSQSAFFNLRVLIGLFMVLAGVFLALLGFGTFSAQAQQNHTIINQSIDPLVPAMFDCSKIRELGIDKQENMRAGAIMIYCGETQGGSASPAHSFSRLVQALLAPLAYGSTDVDLVTGGEISPNVTQSETFTASNPDNPNQIVVAYNDSRGRNATPINISGASVSTDGGNTFTRLTNGSGQSPFSNTVGDPVILYNRPTGTWFTVWLDGGCGGQGLGGYKSTTPWNANSWTHYCIHNSNNDDRESGWADNNPSSPFYGRMYVSWNDFNVGGGALFVGYSTDNGLTWTNARQITNPGGVCQTWGRRESDCGIDPGVPDQVFRLVGTTGARTATATPTRTVLYDQYDNPGPGPFGTGSQDFETGLDRYDDFAADDFVVPAGQTWNISEVDMQGEYFGDFQSGNSDFPGPAVAFHVFFYRNAGGLPGTQVYAAMNQPYTTSNNRDFVVNLSSPAVLPAGRYWVSVQARMDFSEGGQWFWIDRTVQANNGAAWQQPNSPGSGPFIRDVQITGDLATGDVYIAGMNEGGGGFPHNNNNLFFRSTDGGNTWTNTYTGPSFPGPGVTAVSYFACMFSDGGGYWRHEGWGEPAVFNHVVSYVYDQHGTGSDPGDVYYIRSTDSGVTFSAPFKLNTDATTRPQWQPNLSVSPTGTLLAVWYDARESASCTRGSPGVPCYRMWARRSTDNGASWLSDQTFSDVVSPLPSQPDPGIQATYAGDYDYASSSSNQHLHAWVDGRVSISGSSQQDAFHDRQSVGAASPTPTPTATPTPTVQVTVQTSPAGRTFSVDGTTYSSIQTFSWASGSSHTIATTSPQNGATGVRYTWTRWSDNGAISHTVAPTINKTYTATFKTQYYLTMSHGTGGTVSPASGWKNSGTIVSITATPTNNTQVSYRFNAWSGTGSGSYSGTNNPASITMNGPITENASFIQNPVQVTVQTSPAGLTFNVDGTTYTSAQSFSWQPGSSHTIATTSPQSGGTGVQYVWSGWTGGGAISHTVAPTTNKTYTATFRTQYYLTMTHGTGGTVSPASGWKNSGVAVSINAMPGANYHFSNWTGSGTGSYSGTNNPASITMNGPITETGTFTHN